MTFYFVKDFNKQVNNMHALLVLCMITLLISGCGTMGDRRQPREESQPDGDVSLIPNAVPRHEPRSRYGNPPFYDQFGRRYWTLNSSHGFVEQGIASWYGKKFHGGRASSGETYDMYKMTAAHKTLPLPSYVEVTNLRNGRKVIVRVNDRGPFHGNRIIDLSYTAARKLDIVSAGTGLVEIRAIDPSGLSPHKIPQKQPAGDRTDMAVDRHSKPPVTHMVSVTSGVSQPARVRPSSQLNTAAAPPIQPPLMSQQQLYIQLGAFSDRTNADRLRRTTQVAINRAVSVFTEQQQGHMFYKVRIGPVPDVATSDQIVHDLHRAGLSDHRIVFQ